MKNNNIENDRNSGANEALDFDNEGHVKIQVMLGFSLNYIKTDKFEDANLKCHFGSIELHFDETKLLNGRGTIKVDLGFGSIELYVPKEWTVISEAKVKLGAVEEKSTAEGGSDNYLNIIGNIRFGALEIFYI